MSQRPRAVFIDFDGTYADHGVVPDAHVDAVRQARRNGHRVFLCTGRPRSMVDDDVLADTFDGVVCAAGGYVDLDGQILSDVRFPDDLGERLVRLLDEHGALYMLEAPQASYMKTADLPRLDQMLHSLLNTQEGPEGILANVVTAESVVQQRFGKATSFGADISLAEIADMLGDEVALVPSSLGLGPGAGEFYLSRITKAVGIAVVEDQLGLDRADIVAIGDGWNDLEMIEYAGTGVAVDVAPPEVARHAALQIPGPQELGIVKAFVELGLIEHH